MDKDTYILLGLTKEKVEELLTLIEKIENASLKDKNEGEE